MFRIFLIKLTLVISINLSGQVQVRDEPRHHNVFENEFLRILDVYLEPGDTTLYHLHNTPSIFIILSNSEVESQLMGGQPAKGANLIGTISYDPLTTPRIHRVWNIDTSWFHVMDVELLSKKQNKKTEVIKENIFQLLFEAEYANGYKFSLDAGKKINIPKSANGYLLISLGKAEIELKEKGVASHRGLKAGHYKLIDAESTLLIENSGNSNTDFCLFQLR